MCANTEESRMGAQACIAALRKMFERVGSGDSETADGYLRNREAAILDCIKQSGELNRYAAGFMAALADFACTCEEGGIPKLDRWLPDAAMTQEEKAAYWATLME